MNDPTALLISYAYVVLVVAVSEVAKRRGLLSSYVTRKSVHAAVGTWILPTLFLFDSWHWAVVPPLTFLVVNAVDMKTGFFHSIEGTDPNNYGPLFFPVAFVVVMPIFWAENMKFAACVGILSMAWGDPLASAAGRAFGVRRYRVLGSVRSLEGSAFMFLGSGAAAVCGGLALGDFAPSTLAAMALSAAGAATAVEAISFGGSDDLTVPVAASFVSGLFAGGGP
jgi:phytol kinase